MRKKRKITEEIVSYWQSYSDMMAALLLVFVLILTFSMLKSKSEMEVEQKKLEEQQILYEEQEKLLKEQEKIFKEQAEKIHEQQEQLDKIVGVKGEIIAALMAEFDDSDLGLSIDSETGTITFDSNLLFDPNQAVLKQTSKEFLDEFLPRYFSILLSPSFKDNVAEVIIEGHTAEYGTYLENLEFSQKRAMAVANYALRDGTDVASESDLNELKKIITVNGRSHMVPKYLEDGSYDWVGSRRVEIKFRLKDDEMVQQMSDILNGKK